MSLPLETPKASSETPKMAQLEIRKGADAEISVGGLRLVACRREVADIDGGITLYVWGSEQAGGPEVEVLRVDLFRNRPHYHAPAERQQESAIDVVAGQIVAWGIEAITTRAQALAEEAGLSSIGAGLDVAALAGAGPSMQALFDRLEEPTEISYFEIPAAVLESMRA
jgi:hypothetical protein